MSSRRIERETVLNMRDLGGLPTRDHRWTRSGLVFRSARLVDTSPGDADWLVATLRLQSYVDLRSPRELERDGLPESLRERGVELRSLPLEEESRPLASLTRPTPEDYLNNYRALVPIVQPALHSLARIIADGVGLPLVIACTAGKDRTGVVVALLLQLIGVKTSAIARDYALTARSLRLRLHAFEAHRTRKGIGVRDYAARFETREGTMRGLLGWCEQQQRALDRGGYWGVPQQTIESVRQRLLSDRPPFRSA